MLKKAIIEFMTPVAGTKYEGMDQPEASNWVKLQDENSEYTEKAYSLNVNAPHLTNLRDVNLLLGGSDSASTKGKKGKGGKK